MTTVKNILLVYRVAFRYLTLNIFFQNRSITGWYTYLWFAYPAVLLSIVHHALQYNQQMAIENPSTSKIGYKYHCNVKITYFKFFFFLDEQL